MSKAAHWLEAWPGRLVLGFAALQLVAWTVLPALVQPNLPLDTIEGLAWGHEWQLGYAKHPPLQAWLLEATAWLFGQQDWPFYLLPQLAVVGTFWLVWKLAREVVDATGAALAVLLLAGIYYFSIPTPEFNPNVLQMPLWAGIGLVLYRALTQDRIGYWLLLGVLSALALYTKYFAVMVFLPLALFILVVPEARRALRSAGPYVAIATGVALFLPHLYWLWQHDFVPFTYAMRRAASGGGVIDHLIYPLNFTLTQMADHAGLLAILLLGRGLRWRVPGGGFPEASPIDRFQRRYIAVLALGPLVAAALVSAVFGIKFRSMWGAPMFAFSGLFCVLYLSPLLRRDRVGWAAWTWVVVAVGALLFVGLGKGLGAYVRDAPSRHLYPGPETANYFTRAWREATGRPLKTVVGTAWIGGNLAFYSDDRPSVFVAGDPIQGFWIDADDLKRGGALLIWQTARHGAEPPAAFARHFDRLEVQQVARFPWRTGAELPVLELGWAIARPKNEGG